MVQLLRVTGKGGFKSGQWRSLNYRIGKYIKNNPNSNDMGGVKIDETYPDPFNPEHLDYQFNLMGGNREHLAAGFFWAFRFLLTGSVSGDYLEFGVSNGRTLANAYHFGTKPNEEWGLAKFPPCLEDMRFFGFDSFQGLPSASGVDEVVDFLQSDFIEGAYDADLGEVLKNMERIGADKERVILVPGWYQQSLNDSTREEWNIEKAALIHVDCDLYESAKLALDFVTPILQDGTVIIFDDFYCNRGHPNRGERRAFIEWQEIHPEFHVTDYGRTSTHNNLFIINLGDS